MKCSLNIHARAQSLSFYQIFYRISILRIETENQLLFQRNVQSSFHLAIAHLNQVENGEDSECSFIFRIWIRYRWLGCIHIENSSRRIASFNSGNPMKNNESDRVLIFKTIFNEVMIKFIWKTVFGSFVCLFVCARISFIAFNYEFTWCEYAYESVVASFVSSLVCSLARSLVYNKLKRCALNLDFNTLQRIIATTSQTYIDDKIFSFL